MSDEKQPRISFSALGSMRKSAEESIKWLKKAEDELDAALNARGHYSGEKEDREATSLFVKTLINTELMARDFRRMNKRLKVFHAKISAIISSKEFCNDVLESDVTIMQMHKLVKEINNVVDFPSQEELLEMIEAERKRKAKADDIPF